MRFATALLFVALCSLAYLPNAAAQSSAAQGASPQRMGPQLRVPSALRNPLDRHSRTGPLRGFTPAHEKNGGMPRPVTEPTLAVRPPVTPSEHQQVQAVEELPLEAAPRLRDPNPPSPTLNLVPEGHGVIVDGTPMDIDFDLHGDIIASGDHHCAGSDCDGCNRCCIELCLPQLSAENLSFFAGVQGFKGPVNRGEDGSFGFSEGFNWGTPVFGNAWNMGAQFGLRAVQTNLHGSDFTSENRHQVFLTAGLFRRADCGLQFGAAIDFLHDDWYAESDVTQFRGEVSWLNGHASEIGFTLTAGGEDEAGTATLFDDQNAVFTVTESRETTDYYAFFYRHQLNCGAGQWRLFGGFTDDSEGILGADADLVLSPCWSLQSGFTYLIPQENTTAGGNPDESWNVGISLVFHPWGGNRRVGNYYRPLFNVADNGSLLVDVE